MRARARFLAALVLVAAGAAAFAIGFRSALGLVYRHVLGGRDVLEAFTHAPWYVRLFLPALGGLLAGLVARKGQGFGDVMEAVVAGHVHLSLRQTARKALGSWLAIAGGGSIGREGPLIQFGGALGFFVSDVLKVVEEQRRVLVAAGVAAGFTAAYNTPLAAIVFVVEVVTITAAVDSLIYVALATAVSTAIIRAVVGGGPIYGERAFAIESNWELLAHALLGLAAGVVAYGFQRLLAAGEWLADRSWLPQPWRAALGGLGVGGLAILLPQIAGNGYEPLNRLLDGEYALGVIVVLLLAKAVATTSSVSSGSPGGVFTPSLFIGGALGAMWGHACASLFHLPVAYGSYALVGMAAATAAMTHAPLMAALLVFELSGDYGIVLPLVVATAGATGIARALKADSVYAAELKRARGLRPPDAFTG
ncbi:MAG: chloride channel protein [Labilithrix sp.]